MEQRRRITVESTDGRRSIAFTEAGHGTRRLLLMHGFGGSRNDFDDWIGVIASHGWHVVAHDHVGSGESDKPDDEAAYSIERFATDAVALADALGWDRFVVLGHSMGGMVAQELALTAGVRLAGLVLMDTGSGSIDLDDDQVYLGTLLAREQGIDALADAVAALGDDGPLANEAHRRLCAEVPGYAERGDRNLRSCSAAMYAAILSAIANRVDRIGELGGIDVRTLVMVGELDAPFVESSRRMAETIPDASLAVIPDAGHSPQFESPDAWWGALSGFLDELGEPSRTGSR